MIAGPEQQDWNAAYLAFVNRFNDANREAGRFTSVGDLQINFGGAVLPKLSAAPSVAPGAGFAKVFALAGTNAGTCKVQVIAGTSTTPVTIVNNVGAGC